MNGTVLLDTGPLVAIFSEADQHHNRCIEESRTIRGPLLTCWPVVTEAAWLLRASPAVVRKLLSAFEGPLRLLPLDEADLPGIAAILAKYKELKVQLVNAALVHLACRESIDTVFTLDRRDFEIMRLPGGKRMRIIP